MLNFNEKLQPNNILYAIDTSGNIYELQIVGTIPRPYPGTKDGEIYEYVVLIHFINESEDILYKFYLPVKELYKTIKLVKIYFGNSEKCKDNKNTEYLIGTDKQSLIQYYINKLDESIVYQNNVVNDGLQQIKNLQNTKDKLYELLKSIS